MVAIIAEYRYLAQSIAGQYGRRHENFAGDGHMFSFESADVAVHFGLKLVAFWKQRRRALLAQHSGLELPLRVGCHEAFGAIEISEGTRIGLFPFDVEALLKSYSVRARAEDVEQQVLNPRLRQTLRC